MNKFVFLLEEPSMKFLLEGLLPRMFPDHDALALAFGNERLRRIGRRARFRDPDSVQQPSNALKRLVPQFQKVRGARKMANFLSRERNTSTSFQVLLSGLDRLLCSESCATTN